MNQQALPLVAKPKRKSPESVRRLSPKEVFQLATFVAAEYVKSNSTDTEFAKHASELLGIPGINQNHVASSREIHGIPSKRFAKLEEAASVSPREQEFADRILSLEKQVRKLFAQTATTEPSYRYEEPTIAEVQKCWIMLNTRDNTSSHDTLLYRFALVMCRGEWK